MRVLALLALVGCASRPVAPPAPLVPVSVDASFDQTWATVIDIFAQQSIPIATIDKASGLIVSRNLSVHMEDGLNWGDCGNSLLTNRWVTHGDFNVLVRPVGEGTSVRATASWTAWKDGRGYACRTKGVWERRLQFAIKNAAEAR